LNSVRSLPGYPFTTNNLVTLFPSWQWNETKLKRDSARKKKKVILKWEIYLQHLQWYHRCNLREANAAPTTQYFCT
jgi:hypothetical protein